VFVNALIVVFLSTIYVRQKKRGPEGPLNIPLRGFLITSSCRLEYVCSKR
jgi:hypothetical protein